jgi:hypothetical protein
MKVIKLDDINLLDVGNTIGLTGSIWTNNEGVSYIALLPEFSIDDLGEIQALEMDADDWAKFIRQSDLVETEILKNDNGNLKKVLVRKTARIIDTKMQWRVFQRDNYTCRYCGQTGIPLSVDHVQLWEEMGPTIEQNLLTSCKKCNKMRGNIHYEDWIESDVYKIISTNLPEDIKLKNIDKINELEEIRKYSVNVLRSR